MSAHYDVIVKWGDPWQNTEALIAKCHSHQDRVLLFKFLKSNDSEYNLSLTHWGRHKMAAILQMTLPNAFPWMKVFELDKNFTEAYSYVFH